MEYAQIFSLEDHPLLIMSVLLYELMFSPIDLGDWQIIELD